MKVAKTFLPDVTKAEKKCYILDANDKILGRVAAKAAHYLQGKHRKDYTPFLDNGDLVVVVNAAKIRVTGKKMTDKIYQRYSGYPGGQRRVSLEDLMKKKPTEAMRLAIDSMIPRGALGFATRRRLRVYADDKHPHQAQQPVTVAV